MKEKTTAEAGREKKGRRVFTLRCSAEEKERFQKKARERNMTLNQFIISSLAGWFTV